MDFYNVRERQTKKGGLEVYPDFKVGRSNDLMIRGGDFYAVWDAEAGLWSTDEYDVQRLVDQDLREYADRLPALSVTVRYLSEFSNGGWLKFKSFITKLQDNYHQLDMTVTFADTKVAKKDYVSRRLPYSMSPGMTTAYDKLMTTLYSPDELAKIEWAIGAVIAGESRFIQKFMVLYGAPGKGKSTVLNLIAKLFPGYYTSFEASALTSSNNIFAAEVFKSNPLIAMQHEGDLSNVKRNGILNSIVSHDDMTVNVKYQSAFHMRIDTFLFIATNKPVKITDGASGLVRRLIDIRPTGNTVPPDEYNKLVSQMDFELGAIAARCLAAFRARGADFYSTYRPLDMVLRTDAFFNFVDEYRLDFAETDMVTLKRAWSLYKEYVETSGMTYKLPYYKFRDELRNYWSEFHRMKRIDGKQTRSVYTGFLIEKFQDAVHMGKPKKHISPEWLRLESQDSVIDTLYADQKAQYAGRSKTPSYKWSNVITKLSDLDTSRVHYVQMPKKHIVIDFDLKDDTGEKSLALNLAAAQTWPPTYAEVSKSGAGLHLHYIYDGDVDRLSRVYDVNIEVLRQVGESSLRRKLTKCNDLLVTQINSGIPLKGPKVVNTNRIKSERSLRKLIMRNVHKEIHSATKPSIDFIKKILEDAYNSGMTYDISDLQTKLMTFAMRSTNHADYCVKVVTELPLASKPHNEEGFDDVSVDDLVFFDVEVFPNLLLINWKYAKKPDHMVRMINPSPEDVGRLFNMPLVGFNNRRYDNHILYARYLGYSIKQVYEVSSKIVSGNRSGFFREAYGLSYIDIYDMSSKKQSLKRFQIELGIEHRELGLPWTEPVPEELWPKVISYCDVDVRSTEDVFFARIADYNARLILSELSGLKPNQKTPNHVAKIIFGDNKNPQKDFVYTDLSVEFPGYKFEAGKSTYRGEEVGEGGYVYAEPGMYTDVAYLDIASMHPTTIERLNVFGPYTKTYSELKQARIHIKKGEYEEAGKMFNGALAKYLDDPDRIKGLAYALKIVINTVYGLTFTKYDNPFRDIRNVDNIVAKRGSLFMVDLRHALIARGCKAFHFKTDSVKIANATEDDIRFVKNFGKKYGYDFGIEGTYSKLCLVNNAVLIGKLDGRWSATGAQFAHPYVFKTLFSNEEININDMTEVKSVSNKANIYLNMNENGDDELVFVGHVGAFTPVIPGAGGGELLRISDGQRHALSGTKNYRWLETADVKSLNKFDDIDRTYFNVLVDKAITNISKFGDFEQFAD